MTESTIFLGVFDALLLMWLIDRYVRRRSEHRIYCLKEEAKYRIMAELDKIGGRSDSSSWKQADDWRKESKAWIPIYPREPDVIPGETQDDQIRYWRNQLSKWETKRLMEE